ncbi:zinc finger MYM-type protein 1-like [Capsicum chacoense]
MITNFFKPQTSSDTSPSSSLPSSPLPVNLSSVSDNDKELAKLDLKSDPTLRKPITEFPPNIRDRVRRYDIQKKPCQPDKFEFPIRDFGERLKHVGEVNRVHRRCFKMMLDLMNPEQSILASLDKQSEKIKGEHYIRLNTLIDVTRYLLKQGLSFRGHNECVTSTRRSNFLDLLKWYADKKEEVKNVVLEKAPKNSTMTSPDIQKDIVSYCAKETLKAIIEDLNGDFFGILVDESKNIYHKEQMALVLRYVNREGKLIERFLGLVHVKDTSAKSLKEAIYFLLLNHSLSRSQIRGQGYNGSSNMQGELNSLTTLILKDNSSAYCVHCFAHQLQLALVAVAKKHDDVNNFLTFLIIRLNQKLGLQRHGDTRWGSHLKIARNFISLFSSIIHVLGVLEKEVANYHEKALAKGLVEDIRSYEFVYMLHLILKILVVTYDLNMNLQRKDQDIISAIKLVDFSKRQFQLMRECKWNSLLEDVSLFCEKNDIMIPKMNVKYDLGKLKRKSSSVTYSHHLHVKVFYVVIDLQLSELNNRFSEVNTDLLLGMASLSPENCFANYDKYKIMKLATYYPNDFSASKLEDLSFDLDNYIYYVREVDNAFSNLKGFGDLSIKLVEINVYKTWVLVYLLVKLSLILPVATATVERAFSSMNFIKNDLRSRIGDDFLNGCSVCYIEDEVFDSVPNNAIIDRFQNMTTRQMQL